MRYLTKPCRGNLKESRGREGRREIKDKNEDWRLDYLSQHRKTAVLRRAQIRTEDWIWDQTELDPCKIQDKIQHKIHDMSAQSSESHINMTSTIISKGAKKNGTQFTHATTCYRSPAFDSSVCSSIWLLSLLLLLLLSLLISLFLIFHSSALHAMDKTQRYRSAHRIKTVGCLQFLSWLYIRLKLFLSSEGGAFRDFQVWHRVQNMLLLA